MIIRDILQAGNGTFRRACAVFAAAVFLFGPATTLAQTPAPGTPGQEHEILQALVGDWEVSLGDAVAGYTNGYIYYAPTSQQLRNVGGAQEDSDCLLAPQWQKLYEDQVAELLSKL